MRFQDVMDQVIAMLTSDLVAGVTLFLFAMYTITTALRLVKRVISYEELETPTIITERDIYGNEAPRLNTYTARAKPPVTTTTSRWRCGYCGGWRNKQLDTCPGCGASNPHI